MELEASQLLQEYLVTLFYGTLLLLLVSFFAKKLGYFWLPAEESGKRPLLSRGDVLAAFGIFLILEIVIIPIAAYLWLSWKAGNWADLRLLQLDHIAQGWLNLLGIALTALGLAGYFIRFRFPQLKTILGEGSFRGLKNNGHNILMGVATWFISYPYVIVVSQFIGLFLLFSFPEAVHADQIAVKQLKTVISSPVLFMTMISAIIFIVPAIEEFLFRGVLQTYLSQRLQHRGIAIAVTSVIFAFFHYASSQGIDNLELLISLFILSCFLGFIYERQRSILSSISLHSFFNAVSIAMIIGQENL